MRPRQTDIPTPLGPVTENIIFLDFDGVLNSSDSWATCWVGPTSNGERLNPDMVKRAARLVNEIPNAKVVVSSAWRIYYDLPYLQSILERFGFPPNAIIDRTLSIPTDDPERERGEEIQEWLDRHPQVKAFVIVDDSADMYPVMGHLIQTTWKDGLQDQHVDFILRSWSRGRFTRRDIPVEASPAR